MSASYHLRPVDDSPASSASTSPTAESSRSIRSGLLLPSPPTSASVSSRSRRPLSPSSLRDVDLTHHPDVNSRKYPAPPTGHDLMAMFPPAPPSVIPHRTEPTSGYFQRQERAFFAQAGAEIVRVHVEVDIPSHAATMRDDKSRTAVRDPGGPRSWPPSGQSPSLGVVGAPPHPNHSPSSSAAYPPSSRSSQRSGPVPVTPSPLFPHPSSTPKTHHPDPTPPGAQTKVEFPDEGGDPDESWKRPMPYAERRRAGKHTRRVIVRN
ncbi:uncharacterized protein ARMOST_14286 [Armillaria ostoyae]|uniref:Uncharacterized protein n=1 Tax=Armillaria ostoyae TaxID=47428 RepID=A0A284RQ59_ARMOS|nr:uncharacterized protein ARMOST_14286 [Armillaria ostoyae]